MNDLQIFENPDFGSVRVVEVDGEPWFVGKDVAEALGYGSGKSLANAVANHVDEEDKGVTELMTPGGKQKFVIINESGLYSLVLSSKLPGAKQFRRWITSEVLPAIRKTGEYRVKKMTDYQRSILEIRQRNAKINSAKLLLKMAESHKGTTFEQVLQAHATKELTGEFLLPLPKLEAKTFSASEIGDMLGISANKVGILANRNNLKTPEYGSWFTDKARFSNKEVQSFRYFERVVPVLRSILEEDVLVS